VDETRLQELSAALPGAAGVEVESGPAADFVPGDFDRRRGKYQSSLVIYHLPEAPAGHHLLAVTEADLYGGGWNFVFGHADPKTRRAVVSLAQLGDEQAAAADRGRRLLTETLHELGHLEGLEHCDQPACAMTPYYALFELDQRRPEYCPRCSGLLGR
jgi:archaemetzincin